MWEQLKIKYNAHVHGNIVTCHPLQQNGSFKCSGNQMNKLYIRFLVETVLVNDQFIGFGLFVGLFFVNKKIIRRFLLPFILSFKALLVKPVTQVAHNQEQSTA